MASPSENTPPAASPSPSPPPPVASPPSDGTGPAPDDIVNEFLYQEGQLDRETEIQRIIKAFRMNPLETLNLPHTATPNDVKRQYRTLSLLVHPDKAKAELREEAEKAFQLLIAARDEMLDDDKKDRFAKVLAEAKSVVTAQREKDEKEHQKKWKELHPGSTPPPMAWILSEDDAVRIQIREVLIDAEWRKRQFLKMASNEESRAAQQAEEKKNMREEKEKADKEWEEGRETRVQTWRSFMKKEVKRKRPKAYKTPDATTNKFSRNVKARIGDEGLTSRDMDRDE